MGIRETQRVAERLGMEVIGVPLRKGIQPKEWISPDNGQSVCPEEAVLGYFRRDGWRGYSGEGGLLLNLIKAMSFDDLPRCFRTAYIESLYTEAVKPPVSTGRNGWLCEAEGYEYEGKRQYSASYFLNNVQSADLTIIKRNYTTMSSPHFAENRNPLLELPPSLEGWMFNELYEVAGNSVIFQIASKFIEDPYEYRRGWPDITMWRNGELRFVEVKTPGDKFRDSQIKIVNEFAIPLKLKFVLAVVYPDDTCSPLRPNTRSLFDDH